MHSIVQPATRSTGVVPTGNYKLAKVDTWSGLDSRLNICSDMIRTGMQGACALGWNIAGKAMIDGPYIALLSNL